MYYTPLATTTHSTTTSYNTALELQLHNILLHAPVDMDEEGDGASESGSVQSMGATSAPDRSVRSMEDVPFHSSRSEPLGVGGGSTGGGPGGGGAPRGPAIAEIAACVIRRTPQVAPESPGGGGGSGTSTPARGSMTGLYGMPFIGGDTPATSSPHVASTGGEQGGPAGPSAPGDVSTTARDSGFDEDGDDGGGARVVWNTAQQARRCVVYGCVSVIHWYTLVFGCASVNAHSAYAHITYHEKQYNTHKGPPI